MKKLGLEENRREKICFVDVYSPACTYQHMSKQPFPTYRGKRRPPCCTRSVPLGVQNFAPACCAAEIVVREHRILRQASSSTTQHALRLQAQEASTTEALSHHRRVLDRPDIDSKLMLRNLSGLF